MCGDGEGEGRGGEDEERQSLVVREVGPTGRGCVHGCQVVGWSGG